MNSPDRDEPDPVGDRPAAPRRTTATGTKAAAEKASGAAGKAGAPAGRAPAPAEETAAPPTGAKAPPTRAGAKAPGPKAAGVAATGPKAPPAKASQAKASQAKASPAKASPAKAFPAGTSPAKAAAPARAARPAKASPAKAPPAETPPAKAPAPAMAPRPADAGAGTAKSTTSPVRNPGRAGTRPPRSPAPAPSLEAEAARRELPAAESLQLPGLLLKVAVALLILGLCGYLIDGANRPANPYLLRTGARAAGAIPSAGSGATKQHAGGASSKPAVGRPAVGTGPGALGTFTPPTLTPAATSPTAPGGAGRATGTGSTAGPAALAGFPTATLSVLTAPGSTRSACVLEARTAAQQAQGLMNQTSLGRYAGMAFVFPRPTQARFYMKDTPMALSIAWFGGDGSFISSQTMPPCPPGTLSCPTYGPSVPYYLALEVPAGGLPGLGIGPGATVQLAGAC